MSSHPEIIDYPALRRPRLKAGVGAQTASLIWAITAAISVIIGLPKGLLVVPLGAIIHLALKWFFQKDIAIMELYMVHEIVPDNLNAGFPAHGEKNESRVKGFARGLPIQ